MFPKDLYLAEWDDAQFVAVAFRSNTHTLPNWRLPPIPETHSDLCTSEVCRSKLECAREQKVVSKLAQRAQRQCTAHYCGYTFKPQPVVRKYLRGAAETLNYLTTGMKDKNSGQQWHRITYRLLTDFQHRCMRRSAPEISLQTHKTRCYRRGIYTYVSFRQFSRLRVN